MLELDCTIGFSGEKEAGWQFEAQLYDPSGKSVFRTPRSAAVNLENGFKKGRRLVAEISAPVPRARLWSSEKPELYTAVVTLVSPRGQRVEATRCRVGFRRVEVRDRQLLVNGRAVMIKGVNRHEHDDVLGKVISRESMIRDIRPDEAAQL